MTPLLAAETDARLRIWMRVVLGGERLASLARELGYSDGSGVLRVVRRLTARAADDRDLAGKMAGYRRQINVEPTM